MKAFALFILFVLLVMPSVYAKCPIDVSIELEKNTIYPEENLRFFIYISLCADATEEYVFQFCESNWDTYEPQIWLSDENNAKMPYRMTPPPMTNIFCCPRTNLLPGEFVLIPVELHRWFSTDLPTGKYQVNFDKLEILYLPKNDLLSRYFKADISLNHLSFDVLNRGDIHIEEFYKGLYEEILGYGDTHTLSDAQKAKIQLLITSLGNIVSKYQVNLYLSLPPCLSDTFSYPFWPTHILCNALASTPSINTILKLIEHHEKHCSEMSYNRGNLRDGIGAIITQYSTSNNPELRALADDFLAKNPELRLDHCPTFEIPTKSGYYTLVLKDNSAQAVLDKLNINE